MQFDVARHTVHHASGHVGAVRLPTTVGRRTGVEQSQPTRRRAVPRDMAVPEHQHVRIWVRTLATCLPPGLLSGFVHDDDAHTSHVGSGDLGQALPQLIAVIVAPAADQPGGSLLELVQQPGLDPVTGMNDDIGAVHFGPHLRRKVSRSLGNMRIRQQQHRERRRVSGHHLTISGADGREMLAVPPNPEREGTGYVPLMEQPDERAEPSSDPIRLTYLIGRLDHAVRRELDKRLAAHDLTVAQFTTLSVLTFRPGLSNAQLARRVYVT